jgi:hypothetical protein
MKKIAQLIIVLLGVSNSICAQTFYDNNSIQDIRIVFVETNWDALLDAQASGAENYIAAQSVTINGVLLPNVGVKYKGNSSYNAGQVKNPIHIELDTYQAQDYDGYTDIKLSNIAFDPSYIRDNLAYTILRQYMHAPLSNFANVYINGNLIGLYTSTESISKKFVNNHFYSNDNTFVKCNPIGGAGPMTTNLPSLSYLGTDSASYYSAYEMNSATGWQDLIDLTNRLSNDITNIENILDVDRVLWMLAFDNVTVNLDSYLGQFKQNYYLYKDDNGRFNPIVWDMNMSFGTFAMTGTISLSNTTAKRQLTHLLHAGDAAWPLVQKLLAVPRYKKMYLAHFSTILLENFSNTSYTTTAQTLQTLINPSVAADVNGFFTFTQFQNSMTTDVTGGMNNAPGISNLMGGRYTYLSTQTDFTNTKPAITSVTPSNASPAGNSSIYITANVLNTNTDAVFLGYRAALSLPFTKTLMYDDGAHGDGAAGDNVYGASLLISNSYMQYYIYAENNNIGKFSPERAEHEFYTINAIYPTINAGELAVNEIMASNVSTVTDPNGQYEDWVELYNNSANTLSLDNLYMSDGVTNMVQWQFPAGTTIAPNSYLIVWCDGDTTQSGLHSNFKLTSAGENVVLSYANGTVVDNVAFGLQTADVAYARIPNGTGSFVNQSPTYLANNETASLSSHEDFGNFLTSYPNPTNGVVSVANQKYEINQLAIYNLQGQLLFENKYTATNEVKLDFSNYTNGVYMLIVNQNTTMKIIKN